MHATLDVRPISGALGAEVRGVNLGRLDPRTSEVLRHAWLEHLVLFFPDQNLTPEELLSVARAFGEPRFYPYLQTLSDDLREIVVLTGASRADAWHTDLTYCAEPPMASILQLKECPTWGGDTMWTNQYLAFERLSRPMQEMLDGMTAIHNAANLGHPEDCVEHPLVVIHPETGRRALYVNEVFTSQIPQLGPSESDALLEFLCGWSQRPEFQCRYQWSRNAIAMWDNRCTQHRAVNDYEESRVGHRVTLAGTRPEGSGARWAKHDSEGKDRGRYGARFFKTAQPKLVDRRLSSNG